MGKMNNIPQEVLDALGVFSTSSKVYPNNYYVPHVGYVNLFPSMTVEDILQMIFDEGRKAGERQGKEAKIKEIKQALDLE